MTNRLSIQNGAVPWQPGDATELLETLHYYDIPLAGLLRQDDRIYLFWCVEGQTGPENLWAYAEVDEEEAAIVRDSGDPDSALAELTAGKPLVVALAREGSGIVASVRLEPTLPGSVLDAAIETFGAMRVDLEGLRARAKT